MIQQHFVSAVVYNIFTPPSIPIESPEAYTTFINDGMHKVRPRLVYCSVRFRGRP